MENRMITSVEWQCIKQPYENLENGDSYGFWCKRTKTFSLRTSSYYTDIRHTLIEACDKIDHANSIGVLKLCHGFKGYHHAW